MPKVWFYECKEWECIYGGVMVAPNSPRPINCGCGGSLLDNYQVKNGFLDSDLSEESDESEDEDYEEGTKLSPRPSWESGRREKKRKEASSPGGTLYCQICKKKIEVNSDGKEEWYSKKGNFKQTSPHLDHFGSTPIPISITGGVKFVTGDWVQRKSKLRNSKLHMKKSTPERKKIEKAVFNASPLRTTHMKCNCSRPKKRRKK